jgi:AraC-like DNA-binding protein
MKTKTKSFHTIISNYLEILLLKLADKTLYCKEHLSVSHSTYLQCRDYINRNFSKIITIQTVADQCNVDKGYVCRLFRKYTHTTPMSYVIKLKMDKAVMLLTQTDISIKKIGYMLNFENQYYFSRIFKKIYGVSPKFYRQQH